MNLPFYIAGRYLKSKKSHNAINIISGISVIGVAIGTMALIIVLSVFNGFDTLVKSLLSSFDPDLKIEIAEGKSFTPSDSVLQVMNNMDGVAAVSGVLEENALLRYDERQYIATIKGVDDQYKAVTGVDTMMREGSFELWKDNRPMAVVGEGISYFLGIGLNFVTPINIYVIKRTGGITVNPQQAVQRKYIFPSGIFSIEQETNTKYMFVPIAFARELMGYTGQVTALEVKLAPGARTAPVQEDIETLMGGDYTVKNRYQQNELFYRIMRSEKWAIFFILTFILIIASFNIIGSLTMLILDKKEDINILRSLGAWDKLIRKIFLVEGWLISFTGAFFGLILGSLIALAQQKFEIIKLKGSGSFVIDAYPVVFRWTDMLMVLAAVLIIGGVTAWLPARFISKKYLLE